MRFRIWGWSGMWVREAVRNNAAWCDAVCRAHGRPGRFGERSWTNARRTPIFYPDAVTLTPEATVRDVLDHVERGPGASVKDSFARLDLPGFEILFDAEWIHRPAGDPTAVPRDRVEWDAVTDETRLREWETAWSGGQDGHLFPAALLANASVRVLRGRIEGDLVCGGILNVSDPVVGVSNVFASGCDVESTWAGIVATAARLFPGAPLVGYETGGDLVPALRNGFTTIGPLRVWIES